MRTLLAALLLVTAAPLAHAGVLVEFTDGTTLTVESHWNDGERVHLVRGGVDVIVAKSRIKAIDENVADPEVYRNHGNDVAETDTGAGEQAAAAPGGLAAAPPAAADPGLSGRSAEELEALDHQEAARLLELREKAFNAAYGRRVDPRQREQVDEALAQQNRRTAEVRTALEQAKKTETGVPTAPAVEQPQ